MNHLRDQQLASGAGLKAPHSPLYSQNALYKDCREEAKARSWEGKTCLYCLLGPATSLTRLIGPGVSPPGGQGQAGDGAVRGVYVLGVQNP